MRLLTSVPIRYKLFIIIFASSLVLLIHTVININKDFSDAKKLLFSTTQYQANLIAKTCSPGLLFDVPQDAQEIINDLVDDSAIVIFNKAGERFASYEPQHVGLNIDSLSHVKALMLKSHVDVTGGEYQFSDDRLFYLKQIIFDGEYLGHVYLEKDLSVFQQDIHDRLMMTLTIFFIALVAALILAWIIQDSVTKPIQELASSIKGIATFKDYSVRVDYQGKDEIAALIKGFNSMLEQIQHRDQKLNSAKNELELTVEKRTRQLRLTNQELERSIHQLQQAQQQAFENELAKEKAETRERAKTDFLTHMSHELRTPLNGIDGMLSMLKDTRLEAQQMEYVTIASDSSAYLLSLLSDILDLAKVENEAFNLEQHEFDLIKLFETCLDIYTQKAHAKQLDLALDFNHDFTQWAIGDSTRIKQLINNLISNAIKFTREGYIHVSASSLVDGDELYLSISVKDSGIGISPQGQREIFKVFSQADTSTTREFGGTGVGLALCKKIAEAMNGGITVESNEGAGSAFHVTLQLKVAQTHGNLRTPLDLFGVKSMPRTVAILGPDCLNIQQLKRYLLEVHVAVDVFDSGHANTLDLSSYHLVLFYLQDGQETEILEVQQRCVNTLFAPILWREDLLQNKALVAQFCGYLTLPIFAEKLGRELQQILNRSMPEADENAPLAELVSHNALSHVRILLVEDNEVNQKVAKGRLDKLGVEVVMANNGLEALELFQQYTFDMILMDCQMPVMDGYQATQNIRLISEAGKKIPIIAITANAIKGDRERCLSAGMDDYITKPIKQDVLLQKIQYWLDPSVKSGH